MKSTSFQKLSIDISRMQKSTKVRFKLVTKKILQVSLLFFSLIYIIVLLFFPLICINFQTSFQQCCKIIIECFYEVYRKLCLSISSQLERVKIRQLRPNLFILIFSSHEDHYPFAIINL